MKIRSTRKSPELDALVREAIVRDRKAESATFFATMKLDDHGDCQFLNENRLCSLQIECGHGVLPDICREFPRKVNILDGLVTRTFTPACEGVVQLLRARPNGIRFHASKLTKPLSGQKVSVPEGYIYLYNRFEDIQTLTIRILQNRAYHLDERIILLGMALQKLAEFGEDGNDEDVEAWLSRYIGLAVGDGFQKTIQALPKNPQLFLGNNLRTIRTMPGNRDLLESIARMMKNLQIKEQDWKLTYNINRYAELKQMLEQFFSGEEYLLENLLVNEWFRENCPLDGSHGVWEIYVRFCMLYSLLKFMLTASMAETTTMDDIVQTIVEWSRILLHNRKRADALTKEFHQNNSDTLAHMAILVNG